MTNTQLICKYPELSVLIRSVYNVEGSTVGHVVRWMDSNPLKVSKLRSECKRPASVKTYQFRVTPVIGECKVAEYPFGTVDETSYGSPRLIGIKASSKHSAVRIAFDTYLKHKVQYCPSRKLVSDSQAQADN